MKTAEVIWEQVKVLAASVQQKVLKLVENLMQKLLELEDDGWPKLSCRGAVRGFRR